jgi:hypothetical protein
VLIARPYGDAVIKRLARDLGQRFELGFGVVNLTQMRRFFLAWPQVRESV